MKILVTKKGIVECYEDSYEEGELDYANSWDLMFVANMIVQKI